LNNSDWILGLIGYCLSLLFGGKKEQKPPGLRNAWFYENFVGNPTATSAPDPVAGNVCFNNHGLKFQIMIGNLFSE